ncbi:hypothetical protein J421_5374 (plasmid) [Gemmatirosa kalamazoonensis]|jgi:hypothetical protein|uniref:Periplasmic heavy metal sensor n=1 Tax=Gemmatirosa kalamazoonensis TaxID=861299 RepID=W0RPH6_9BACT|nr:hypothetical protein [Gemmatirosa kalamazoonensis]AHG92909.1 hypothetical protein J421_5374 [Gemmatirosa kalamazoonensis]
MTEPGDRLPADDRAGARTRARLAAAAALLLVFVAGVGAGWGGRPRVCRPRRGDSHPPAWLCGRRGGGPGGGGDPLSRIGVSAAERARVDSAVKRRQPQVEAFWRGPGQQLRTILDSMHADVRAALDPAHRAAFDSIPAPWMRGPGGGGRRGGGQR